jgi:hypothetical protein
MKPENAEDFQRRYDPSCPPEDSNSCGALQFGRNNSSSQEIRFLRQMNLVTIKRTDGK